MILLIAIWLDISYVKVRHRTIKNVQSFTLLLPCLAALPD